MGLGVERRAIALTSGPRRCVHSCRGARRAVPFRAESRTSSFTVFAAPLEFLWKRFSGEAADTWVVGAEQRMTLRHQLQRLARPGTIAWSQSILVGETYPFGRRLLRSTSTKGAPFR